MPPRASHVAVTLCTVPSFIVLVLETEQSLPTPRVPEKLPVRIRRGPLRAADLLFAGSGEMRAICRDIDWSTTPLGMVEQWPLSLRTLTAMVMAAAHPMFLWWGPAYVQLFNDAYRPSFGSGDRFRHAVGASGPTFWTEIWAQVGADAAAVQAGSGAVSHHDQLVPILRNGVIEDVWWSYSYNPVHDDDGQIAGVLVVCEETTTRVLAERVQVQLREDARRADRRSARIIEQITDEHLTLDSEFRIVTINAAAERSLGVPREHLLNRTHWDAFPASVGSVAEMHYRRAMAERVEIHFAHRYVGEGYDRHLEIDVYPTDDDGIAVFWRDVTDRVHATKTLGELGTRYRTLFESIDTGVALIEMVYDGAGAAVDYRFLEVNAAFTTHTGIADAVGQMARTLIPDLEPFWIETYARVAATGESTRFQHGSAGIERMFDVFAHRIGEPQEHRLGLVFTDITAATRATRERDDLLESLALERAKIEEVFCHTPAFLAVLEGPGHVFTLVNTAYYQLVGHRALLGKPLFEAIPEAIGQGFDTLLDRVLTTGEPFVGIAVSAMLLRTPGAPPEVRFVDVTYTPLRAVGGVVTGIIASGVDVTSQIRTQREREHLLEAAEAARAEAVAANRGKSDFLAIMSHELRTPLNAIDGYAELMELGIRGPVTDEQRHDLGRIRKSQEHLLGLINGVLNYAQVEAGAVHYDMEAVSVEESLSTCEALTMPQARSNGLTLHRESCDASIIVRADQEKLQQIVLNLLSNAIKFTNAGGRITLRCVRSAHSDAPVRIEVTDTGIGIAGHQVSRVFEPFVQVDAELTRTRAGTGLGLAISRDLARAMGGDLSVTSTLGAGSTFTLTLPAA